MNAKITSRKENRDNQLECSTENEALINRRDANMSNPALKEQ